MGVGGRRKGITCVNEEQKLSWDVEEIGLESVEA